MKKKEIRIEYQKINKLISLSQPKKSIIKIENNWLFTQIVMHQVKNS